MILALEIAMIVIGLLAIVRGKLTISKTKVVSGGAARLLGVLALTPLPVAFVAVGLFVAAAGAGDPEKFVEDKKFTIALIEAGVVIGIAALVFGIGAAIAQPPKPEREFEDEEDDVSDPPPRKRRRRDDEDDDEYDR